MRGVTRVFKAAARRDFEDGSGFWLCPHLWFVSHLSRDNDDVDGWFVGPPYHKAFTQRARRHAYLVMTGLELDLIFVEDGVGIRRLKRVLQVLFECYDVYGPKRLAHDRHFFGLPGVRVLIHECGLDEPLRSTKYPEPDYEDIGRARILHVFRDRGEDEEPVESPRDADYVPTAGDLLPLGSPA